MRIGGPIEKRCRELGSYFKFVCVQNLEGFKAAALRIAIAKTAIYDEIVGVIDADYVIDPRWLRDLVPRLAGLEVGLIQAPRTVETSTASAVAEFERLGEVGKKPGVEPTNAQAKSGVSILTAPLTY